MYYPDLSPYQYFVEHRRINLLNIGWLEKSNPFPKGEVPERALSNLLLYCTATINPTRGYHPCDFCDKPQISYSGESLGRELLLGSAEIRVPGNNGKIYAAPNLIYHYVADHSYRPPDEFVDALMTEPIRFLDEEIRHIKVSRSARFLKLLGSLFRMKPRQPS
jgi:hypothetical protein